MEGPSLQIGHVIAPSTLGAGPSSSWMPAALTSDARPGNRNLNPSSTLWKVRDSADGRTITTGDVRKRLGVGSWVLVPTVNSGGPWRPQPRVPVAQEPPAVLVGEEEEEGILMNNTLFPVERASVTPRNELHWHGRTRWKAAMDHAGQMLGLEGETSKNFRVRDHDRLVSASKVLKDELNSLWLCPTYGYGKKEEVKSCIGRLVLEDPRLLESAERFSPLQLDYIKSQVTHFVDGDLYCNPENWVVFDKYLCSVAHDVLIIKRAALLKKMRGGRKKAKTS